MLLGPIVMTLGLVDLVLSEEPFVPDQFRWLGFYVLAPSILVGTILLLLYLKQRLSIVRPRRTSSIVLAFDRRMFAFGALYGGGMAAGCPVPYYWAILFWVAISGNPLFGALVLGVHGFGYTAPVLAIVVLSRMGISVIKSVPKSGERLQKLVSAGMLTTGVFLVAVYIVIRVSILLI